MPVFTINDASKILEKDRKYVKLYLHRCLEKGLIARVQRGTYYVVERSNELEIASSILPDSYISLMSALSYYGLTTQIPRVVYVLSPNRHKTIKNVMGYDISFRRIQRQMLFGYRRVSKGNISIAEPEKAIIDTLYLNHVMDVQDSVFQGHSKVSIPKLIKYAKSTKKKTVLERVLQILTNLGYDKKTLLLRNHEERGE